MLIGEKDYSLDEDVLFVDFKIEAIVEVIEIPAFVVVEVVVVVVVEVVVILFTVVVLVVVVVVVVVVLVVVEVVVVVVVEVEDPISETEEQLFPLGGLDRELEGVSLETRSMRILVETEAHDDGHGKEHWGH
ncbi:hypothetical protein HDU83_001908 [Entophlyctis luteolus]|nr:hypothetical protein HDU83_001908 [Entophlyctis luteolus]